MADANPWSETPTYNVYVPTDKTSLENRIKFLIDVTRKKSREISDIMYEIESCNKKLKLINDNDPRIVSISHAL